MKNIKSIYPILIMIISLSCILHYKLVETDMAQKNLADSTIRFHVRANSNSVIDQQLKMKVKEAVVNYIYDNTGDFKSQDEAAQFIITHDSQIKSIANKTITDSGFSYSINSTFSEQIFPTKTYGDITFPTGKYRSYTLYIGNGKGHNWWCVLYPPLCFVDASTGIVPDSSKERLKEHLSEKEYQSIIKYRFKYLTFLNQYLD